MTIVKSTQSAVIPIYYVWVVSYCSSWIWLHVYVALHPETTLQFLSEDVLQGWTLQMGKSYFHHRPWEHELQGTTARPLPESRENLIFLFSPWVTRCIYLVFEETAFDLGVHPLRGQESFLSVMVYLILKQGNRSKTTCTINTHWKQERVRGDNLMRGLSGHGKCTALLANLKYHQETPLRYTHIAVQSTSASKLPQ